MQTKIQKRRSGHERRKSETEIQKESARWRCDTDSWRARVWRLSDGKVRGEFSDGGCEAQRVRGLSGNQGRSKSDSVGGDNGALRRGRYADPANCGQRHESEEGRFLGGV